MATIAQGVRGRELLHGGFFSAFDFGAFSGLDNRRVEVIADGLTLCPGAQLAITTTLVSSVRGDGSTGRGAATHSCKKEERK